MTKEIKLIRVATERNLDETYHVDTFTNESGKLSYSISDNQYNNLYIMKDELTVAYYPAEHWFRLYINYEE